MKIGIVCPYNILKGGGVQEHVKALQAGLQARGYEAKIITPLPRDTEIVEIPNVIFVGTSTDFRSMHTSAQISATADIDKIDQMLQSENFDILHFHEPWVPILSRQILQRSNSINIATFHAKVPETIMSRTLVRVVIPYTKSILKYFDQLTAVSDSASVYARSLTDEPITIVPNGIDLSIYKRSAHKVGKQKQILYIGRLERRKGVKYLLQAFQLLSERVPNVTLKIAGGGPDLEKLQLLAEDLKLTNVEFIGYISEEEKHRLFDTSDIFCSPAVYGESFGIVLLEAMAKGVVTVAGNNSGYMDVMKGIGGLSIVDPHDASEFARRLELLLTEDSLRKLWQDWAVKYVKEFSYERVIDEYEQVYKHATRHHE